MGIVAYQVALQVDSVSRSELDTMHERNDVYPGRAAGHLADVFGDAHRHQQRRRVRPRLGFHDEA